MDIKVKSVLCDNLSSDNSGAIFLAGLDGELRIENKVAARLLDAIGSQIECLLPEDHNGLVRACLKTGHDLKRQYTIDELNIVWSYQISEKLNHVYIRLYIYDPEATISKKKSTAKEIRLESNSLPLITYLQGGDLQFFNPATSELLSELNLENVEDLLPFSHYELLDACFQGTLALTEARCVNGRTYVWTYEADSEMDEVNIYMRDLTISPGRESAADASAWKNRELEFLADISGATKFISYATYKLLDELGVSAVDEILSTRHAGLIKACLATSTELTEECKLSNRSIVWTYCPHIDGESVQVYGYEAV